jgi:hypothetical protein
MTLSMHHLELPGLLYRYFSLSGNVSIPGLGALTQTRIAAVNDFIGRRMMPPSKAVKFNPGNDETTPEQANYIARLSGKNNETVVSGLKKLGEELRSRLQVERKVEWMDVGIFSISDEGEIGFVPKTNSTDFFSPVEYVHVLRDNAEHAIVVGEGESTNTEMEVFFEDQRANADANKWQKAAIMLVILTALLLLMRFMTGSFDLLEPRYNPLKFTTPAPTYRVV